jgi:5'-deoxynucleotidase YfbR-like HD superfamily hydrolase
MPVDDDSIRLDTRLAGQVKRYHTWPVLREQSIAEHCWQLMRIYMATVPDMDPNMVAHIMLHDIGEHFTGDIPYPVKSQNEGLKVVMDHLERKSQTAQLEYWDSFHKILLTNADRDLFKQIELMEMAEFGIGEVLLGNNHGFIVADRCLQALYEKKPCVRLCQYASKRLRLFYLQCQIQNTPLSRTSSWWNVTGWEKLHDSK